MATGKERLYVALYYHSPGAYHWAFLVSPKDNPDQPGVTVRYHVTNKVTVDDGVPRARWEYEQRTLPLVKTNKMLVRVLVGKLEKPQSEFEKAVRNTPVIQGDPAWRCRTWTINAMDELVKDKVLSSSSIVDWGIIEAGCREYVERKVREKRFEVWTQTIPTYDLMLKKEVVA